MNKNFSEFMKDYEGKKLAVAVSGGVDSICLLHWLVALKMDIIALHVNHQLRPSATEETEYVQNLCKKLKVPCRIFYWKGEKPSSGLEAAAREARYKFMTDFCRQNGIEYLLLAHQADDQIETFLMNLARGSGLYGLAAIRPSSTRDSITLVRPLLHVYRKEIKDYCDRNDIKYYMDEMNQNPQYTRVKIRQNQHLLADKLGISKDRILLAIDNLNRAAQALYGNMADLVSQVLYKNYALFSDSFLFDQPSDIRLKLLGTLIKIIGGNNYQPRLNSLHNALDNLRCDCKFTLGHCTIRRLGKQIIIVREGEKTSFRKRNGKQQKRRF